MRRVTDQMVRTHASPELLTEAAEAVEQASALLEPATPPWETSLPAMPATDLDPHVYFPFSPMIGWYSPLSSPLECEVHGQTIVARATFGAAYEGPPGCVHGGIIAGLFDELLGIANITAGVGAMTGTLTVVYRRPTPLYTELTFRGETDRIEGRKVFTRGTLHAGDQLCAEAEGIFIHVVRERFEEHAHAHGAHDEGGRP
jgi:acyl-coenzyme A thioesterase PaaI-like protein